MSKVVYCPKCGRAVLRADERAYITLSVKCKKCNKLVVYHPTTEEIEITSVPARQSSSGTRFY